MDTATRSLRLLIADDFAPVRRRLSELLADEPGLEVAGEAASVAGTLEAIRRLQPDLVLLDLSMPDGSGIEVLRRTRELQPRPLFIVLSGNVEQEYRVEAERQQADAYLDKGGQFDQVLATIRLLALRLAARPLH